MKLKNISLILVFALLAGCQSTSVRRNTDQYYASSGIEKYFLSDIPEWVNFSEAGMCSREGKVRYLDLPKLMDSYNYSLSEAVQFQNLVNRLRVEKMQELRSNYLRVQDEEIVFHDATDKIANEISGFEASKYPRVNLIWIDRCLNDSEALTRLKTLLNQDVMNVGYPMLVSECLNAEAMSSFIAEHKIYEGVGTISAEFFTVYGSDKKFLYRFALPVESLFDAKQEVHLYLPNDVNATQKFSGNYQLHHF